jgi:hypothetical protein
VLSRLRVITVAAKGGRQVALAANSISMVKN